MSYSGVPRVSSFFLVRATSFFGPVMMIWWPSHVPKLATMVPTSPTCVRCRPRGGWDDSVAPTHQASDSWVTTG